MSCEVYNFIFRVQFIIIENLGEDHLFGRFLLSSAGTLRFCWNYTQSFVADFRYFWLLCIHWSIWL